MDLAAEDPTSDRDICGPVLAVEMHKSLSKFQQFHLFYEGNQE
jgi:hypothetical protein